MDAKGTKISPGIHYITLVALLISNLSTFALGIILSNMIGASMGDLLFQGTRRKLAEAALYYDDGSSGDGGRVVRKGGKTSTPPSTNVFNVVWANTINVTASGNSLQKTGGCDGCTDAGAVSTQSIASGDGYVEFTASELTTGREIGLSNGNTNTSGTDIDFSIELWRTPTGYLDVRENGVYKSDATYVTGDVFRIAVVSGQIKYSKNGTVFYTSVTSPTYPLLVDTALFSSNATINNAVILSGGVASPDTTPPTVSLTAPAPPSTVSGTIAVSANATDNVGVAGVQFKLDGVNLAAEDTVSPYGVSWDTTAATIGSHSLIAIARDAAGNTATTPAVTVTVSRARGGFIEKSFSSATRPRLTTTQIAGFLPTSRGVFTFPAPYNTAGIRITDPSDCSVGADCVTDVGYSYWRNINNHVASSTLYIFLGLNKTKGGGGPTLFSYNKVTDQISKVGPLFASSDPLSYSSGEGWYFSGTQPTKLYVVNQNYGTVLYRYDILSKELDPVLDIATQPALYGTGRYIRQTHSSDDDRVHVGTMRDIATSAMLGCFVYREDTRQYSYYLSRGGLNECNLDASGRWLIVLDKVSPTTTDLDNRIIDLQTGTEQVVLDEDGGLGHLDMGDGYAIGSDNNNPLPGAVLLWQFPLTRLTRPVGSVIYYTSDWFTPKVNHISHENRKSGVAANLQYACGSDLNRQPYENEIYCFRLNGSFDEMVVAPAMSNATTTAAGGDGYANSPKGNVDVSGNYFIWTSNMGGSNRLDAFLVKIPSF